MTEKQLRARIDRLQQLIAGLSKGYTHQRYAIGLHVYGGRLSTYAIHIGKAYRELSEAKMALVGIVDGMKRNGTNSQTDESA
jgi:hypothetical protein